MTDSPPHSEQNAYEPLHAKSHSIDRILRSRAPQERTSDNGKFGCYTLSDGRPQVAFTLRRSDGALDGFMYHNIENVALSSKRGTDYLSFDHRGKVVVISGKNLEPIFQSLMGLQLLEIISSSEESETAGEPFVQTAIVTHLNEN